MKGSTGESLDRRHLTISEVIDLDSCDMFFFTFPFIIHSLCDLHLHSMLQTSMLAPVEFERYGHAEILQTSAIQPQNGKAPSTLAQHDAIYEAWMWMWISERAPDLRRDRAKRQNCIDASVISTISSLFKQEHFDAMVSFAPKTVNSLDVCEMTMACVKVMFQSPGKVYILYIHIIH